MLDPMLYELHIKVLLLIVIANGAPILARNLFRTHFDDPVDLGLHFFDKRRLFGPTKTMRGIFMAVMITPVAAHYMDINWFSGFLVGLYAMSGDLFSSFVKRRKGFEPSEMAFGLDQVPEALFPLLALMTYFKFSLVEVLVMVGLFAIIELVFSRILYFMHIRLHPY